jgi:Tfp pilus assembly protein PilF
MSDASERTLPATSRRRQLAEREGMLPTAALPAWGAGVAVTVLLLPSWWRATLSAALSAIQEACASDRLAPQAELQLWPTLGLVLPTVAVIVVAASASLAIRLFVDGFRWHPGSLTPDLRRIDPLAGLRRIIAPATLSTAAGGLVWLALPAWVASRSLDRMAKLVGTIADGVRVDAPLPLAVSLASGAIPEALALLGPTLAATVAVAVVRWLLLRRRGEQRIRMTPEELREELRSLEASPAIRWGRPAPSRAPAPGPGAAGLDGPPPRPRTTAAVTVSAAVMLGVVAMGSGCRLVNRHSAVPQQQLAEARRLSNEGLSAADQQDLAGAETLLAQAVKRCPTDIDARRHYASVLWQRGEQMEAVEQINEALRLAPDDVPLCLAGGRMTMELGLLDDADRLASAALQAAPQSADAWHLRGQVSLARGQDEAALADFHHGLAIAPDDRGLLLDTAEVYRRLGRPRRALSTLAALGESYGPQQTPGLVLALEGMALEALGRTEDARDSYQAAIARGGAPADTTERLANLDRRAPDGPVAAATVAPPPR